MKKRILRRTILSRSMNLWEKLDHPFKAEVEMMRGIIKNVNKDIAEQIKWNAPSSRDKGEALVTFNLWEKGRIHLVFHNPMISRIKSKLIRRRLRPPQNGLFLR